MSAINMSEMKAFFAFLFKHRLEEIEGTAAWSLFSEAVSERWAVVRDWRPSEPEADSSLAEALRLHRAWGRSLRGLCTAVLNAPGTSEEAKAAAEAIRKAVRPVKDSSMAVAVLSDAEQEQGALRQQLSLLPAPARRWFAGWIESGRAVNAVHGERFGADAEEGGLPRNFMAETRALLGQVRAALRHEARFDPGVSTRLEARVFAYWDDLRRRSPARVRSAEAEPSSAEDAAVEGVER